MAIFFSLSRLHAQFPILTAVRIVMILTVIALASLLGSVERWKPKDLANHWIPRGLAVIASFAIVGIPFALWPGRAFDYFSDSYGKTLLLGVLTWAIARTPNGVRLVGRTIALAGFSAAGLALYTGSTDRSGRLSGAFTYDPNDIALMSLVTIPLALWMLFDRTLRFRVLALPAIGLLGYAIVESGSRGGFLGTMAVLAGFVFFSLRGRSRAAKRAGRLTVLAALFAAPFLPVDYVDSIKSINDQEDYNRTSDSGRIEVWKRGLGYAADYPFLGVGLGNFNTAEGHISSLAQNLNEGEGLKWSTAHNSYIQVAAELGLIPGVVFVLLILRSIRELLRYRVGRSDPTDPADTLPLFLGISILGFAVSGFFLSFAYYDIVYVLLGLASAVLLAEKQPGHGGSPTLFPRHIGPAGRAAADQRPPL